MYIDESRIYCCWLIDWSQAIVVNAYTNYLPIKSFLSSSTSPGIDSGAGGAAGAGGGRGRGQVGLASS